MNPHLIQPLCADDARRLSDPGPALCLFSESADLSLASWSLCSAKAYRIGMFVVPSLRLKLNLEGDLMGDFLKALAVFVIAFALFTLPATWLLMLFFGNLGMDLSYIATLPLGILASVLLGGVTSRAY